MKEIRLKAINKINKSYHVFLGNGTDNSFLSLRDANSFLASTNNFLTAKLHELHTSYVELLNSFHDNWFYFENGRKTKQGELYALERQCNEYLNSAGDLLQRTALHSWLTNANYLVFINFFKIASFLEDLLRILALMYSKHANTNGISKMDVYLKHIMFMRNELENYGKRSTTRLFKIPTHISENKSYVPEFPQLRVA